MSTETPPRHHQPRVEFRTAQPYAAITARARTAAEFRAAVDRDMPALFGWVAAHGLTPAGPPFLRYLVVDETAIPDEGPPPAVVASGVPLAVRPDLLASAGPGGGVVAGAAVFDPADGPSGEERPGPAVHAGELPAGPWLVTLHRGGYAGLAGAHALAHEWAAREGVRVQRRAVAGGTAFGGSVEHFRVGRPDDPDPWRWETDVAYLLGD